MKYLPILSVVVVFQLRGTLASEQCACATSNVHVRDGVGTKQHILSTLPFHHCLRFKGHHKPDSSGDNWANVDYYGQDGWIHEKYIQIITRSSCSGQPSLRISSNVQLPGCPNITTRAEWHARPPKGPMKMLPHTPKYMFIHHGASHPCFNRTDCIKEVQMYQNYHMDVHGWLDIGYHFVVGEDGNVYEGRGWNEVGTNVKGYDNVGLGICIIGNFMERLPNDAALGAVKQMIRCAQDNGKIDNNYILRGHRDMNTYTSCPGDELYKLITKWPHY